MARGEIAVDRARLHRAVEQAEAASGLQICVAICRSEGEPAAQAEAALRSLRVSSQPTVLILVLPESRRVEVRHTLDSRLGDVDSEKAVAAMIPAFAEGDIAGGVELGLDVLAGAAGPGPAIGSDLPDVIG